MGTTKIQTKQIVGQFLIEFCCQHFFNFSAQIFGHLVLDVHHDHELVKFLCLGGQTKHDSLTH